MAEAVTAVPCNAGEYTLIVQNVSSCNFGIRAVSPQEDFFYGRWTFAASQPGPDIDDYKTIRPKADVNLSDLSTSAKIWFKPEGQQSLTVEVVTP